jgi:hypothetical protein
MSNIQTPLSLVAVIVGMHMQSAADHKIASICPGFRMPWSTRILTSCAYMPVWLLAFRGPIWWEKKRRESARSKNE